MAGRNALQSRNVPRTFTSNTASQSSTEMSVSAATGPGTPALLTRIDTSVSASRERRPSTDAGFAHVAGERACPRPETRHDGVQLGLVASDHHHVRPGGVQCGGDRRSEAAAATRHERSTARQIGHRAPAPAARLSSIHGKRATAVTPRAGVARAGMALEQLDARSSAADLAQQCRRGGVDDLLVGHRAQVLADPEAARCSVPRPASAGRGSCRSPCRRTRRTCSRRGRGRRSRASSRGRRAAPA